MGVHGGVTTTQTPKIGGKSFIGSRPPLRQPRLCPVRGGGLGVALTPPPVTVAKCPPTARLPDKPGRGAKSWAAAGGAPPPQHPMGGDTTAATNTPKTSPATPGTRGRLGWHIPAPAPLHAGHGGGVLKPPPPGAERPALHSCGAGGGPGRRVPGTWQRRPLLCLPGGTRRARPRPQILGQGTEKGT